MPLAAALTGVHDRPASTARHAAPPAPAAAQPVTILVSIDGFRPDYLDRGVTPNLNALAAAGISAAMRPSYPSKTFPNHWTLVTGLRPDRTGIVSNNMLDAARPGEKFTMDVQGSVLVERRRADLGDRGNAPGIRTATTFWPGSNVAWGGRWRRSGPTS